MNTYVCTYRHIDTAKDKRTNKLTLCPPSQLAPLAVRPYPAPLYRAPLCPARVTQTDPVVTSPRWRVWPSRLALTLTKATLRRGGECGQVTVRNAERLLQLLVYSSAVVPAHSPEGEVDVAVYLTQMCKATTAPHPHPPPPNGTKGATHKASERARKGNQNGKLKGG